MTAAADFRNTLINTTILKALDSRLYAQLYSDIAPQNIRTISDLAMLPVVTKDQLREHEEEWAVRSEPTAYIQNTTGSTGEPLFIYRSRDEAKFIWEFFLEYASTSTSKLKPLQLHFGDSKHGNPTSIPSHVHVLSGSVAEPKAIDHVLALLRKQFSIPGAEERISILSGQQLPILFLTNFLTENNINSTEFLVNVICTSGRYLTRRWRKVLENVWSVNVIDRYSLSEVFGGASSCPLCGGYHFDTHVIPEVVELTSLKSLSEGLGVLVLTSLYPFVQAQPMIRYLTGDLVELRTNVCHSPAFFLKGRAVHALMDPRKPEQVLLTGTDILEALDDVPFVNRTSHYRDFVELHYHEAVGVPYVRGNVLSDNEKYCVSLEVEVTFTPGLFPDQEEELKQAVLKKLRSSSATFRASLDREDINFVIRLSRPGQLATLEKRMQLWNK